MNNDSVKKTFLVAFLLCIVCSVVVSMAAVLLKPVQERNEELNFKRNILAAAGLSEESKSVEELFEKIEARVVDLETGKFTDQFNVDEFDQAEAAKDAALSRSLSQAEDTASIRRRENFAKVYLVYDANGDIETIILPIKGYGLWSVLYGFVALQGDFNTVVGLGYYEHGETAGLGGEVDNPRWKLLWPGKKIYDEQGEVDISLVKGTVEANDPNAEYKVDALSGATLTSNGVQNMLRFWMGETGYGPFLENLQEGEA
jgi:Na+-transporting NADH:ubiquinone oxidoreductase subunit C